MPPLHTHARMHTPHTDLCRCLQRNVQEARTTRRLREGAGAGRRGATGAGFICALLYPWGFFPSGSPPRLPSTSIHCLFKNMILYIYASIRFQEMKCVPRAPLRSPNQGPPFWPPQPPPAVRPLTPLDAQAGHPGSCFHLELSLELGLEEEQKSALPPEL